jgi:hypothetical protein
MKIEKLWITACVVFAVASAPAQSNTFPASGNVGIGTTSPASQLAISGNLTEMLTQTQTAPMQSGAAYTVGGITYVDNYLRDSATSNPAAYIAIRSVNTYSAFPVTIRGTQIEFGTANGLNGQGTQAATAMTINPSGLVGIGTTSPSTTLQVVSGGNVSGAGGSIGISANSGAAPMFTIQGSLWGNGIAGDAGSVLFNVRSSGTSALVTSMALSRDGNVGIGTTTPGASLEVNGGVKLTKGSGASMTFQDGSVQTVAWNGTLAGADYAESVDVTGDRTKYEPGDVLVIARGAQRSFQKSANAYSTAVMGIYSTKPGVLGRPASASEAQLNRQVPMAMVGIVPTKASAENGPIEPGDLLVTASKPGYAMKGTDRSQMLGAVIGKALGQLGAGTGVIEVAVSLQ